MTKEVLQSKYFDWMYDLAVGDRYLSYRKLLKKLDDTQFTWTIPMDGNRAEDGIDLRYRFGRMNDYPDAMIASLLDDRPCSVLEMMIALAVRCEEHIMYDPDVGDRTRHWFLGMIQSLGLNHMTDRNYIPEYVEDTIRRLLNREYEPDGRGGLYTIPGYDGDLRNIDIWYQMCWYLNEYLDL